MHARWLIVLLWAPVLIACDKSAPTPASTEQSERSTSAKGPRVTASGSVTDGAAIPGVDKVVEGLNQGFFDCYKTALAQAPKTSGSVRVTVDIGATGAIGSASTAASKGIDKSLVSCIATHVRKVTFTAPKGPRSTVMISVELSP